MGWVDDETRDAAATLSGMRHRSGHHARHEVGRSARSRRDDVCAVVIALGVLLGQGCTRRGKTIDGDITQHVDQATGTSVAGDVGATRSHIDALQQLANPWVDAATGLSLLREGDSARPLRLVSFSVETKPHEWYAEFPNETSRPSHVAWRAEYRLAPHSEGREDFDADAKFVVVEERGDRRLTAEGVRIDRKFLVRGLATGRAIVLDVPLRSVESGRLELFLHGAEVTPEIGATHVLIELARDESTRLELRVRAPITR